VTFWRLNFYGCFSTNRGVLKNYYFYFSSLLFFYLLELQMLRREQSREREREKEKKEMVASRVTAKREGASRGGS